MSKNAKISNFLKSKKIKVNDVSMAYQVFGIILGIWKTILWAQNTFLDDFKPYFGKILKNPIFIKIAKNHDFRKKSIFPKVQI